MSINKSVLKATTTSELLSYIINVTPELRGNIDLPVQGQDVKPIGKLILDNERYRNAFINAVNLIGLTIIKRNGYKHPWNFTMRGSLNYGMSVRELFIDLANVYDYHEFTADPTKFLNNVVPNVFEYIHSVNFQKVYQTTTSDAEVAMAFSSEDGLLDFVDKVIGNLYSSYAYDRYLVDKYMLARRMLDGTMTSIQIPDYDTISDRDRVAFVKDYAYQLEFMSPNYNPAGVRRATPLDEQILIMNTKFAADMTTKTLATSFFKNEAELQTNMAMADGFVVNDELRLIDVLGSMYVPFTSDEIATLKKIPCVLIANEFFMDYYYNLSGDNGTRQTEFFNPATLRNNHFLNAWLVFSTSPYEQAIVFTKDAVGVTSVTLSPSEATVTPGQKVILTANVVTTGCANKAVTWTSSVDEIEVKDGVVSIPADTTEESVTITATSVYDSEVTGTATITIAQVSPQQ